MITPLIQELTAIGQNNISYISIASNKNETNDRVLIDNGMNK